MISPFSISSTALSTELNIPSKSLTYKFVKGIGYTSAVILLNTIIKASIIYH